MQTSDNWQHQAMQWGPPDFHSSCASKWNEPRTLPAGSDAVEELQLPPLPSPPLDNELDGQGYLYDGYQFAASSTNSPASSFYQTPLGSASHLSLSSSSRTNITPLLSQASFDEVDYDADAFYVHRAQTTATEPVRRATLPELPAYSTTSLRRGSAPQLLSNDLHLSVNSYNVSPLPSPSLSDSGVAFEKYTTCSVGSFAAQPSTFPYLSGPSDQATTSYRPRMNSAPAIHDHGLPTYSPHQLPLKTIGHPTSSPRIVLDECAPPSPNPAGHVMSSPAHLRRSASNPGCRCQGSPYRLASHPYSPSTPRSFHGFEPSPEFYNGPTPALMPPPHDVSQLASPPPSPASRTPLNGGKARLKFVNFSSSSAEDRVKLLARSSGVKGKKRAAALAAKLAEKQGA